MAQRSKSLGAPSRKAILGTARGTLLCPGRQSNQSALGWVPSVRSGGKFFRLYLCGKGELRFVPIVRYVEKILPYGKIYITTWVPLNCSGAYRVP